MNDDFEDKLRDTLIAVVDEISQATVSLPLALAEAKPDLKSGGQVICCVKLGGKVDGTFALVASGESVCRFASKVLGNEITELNQDAAHVIGEMAMKVAEAIAGKLANDGFGFTAAPVQTISDIEFDEVKSHYMLAIRKAFSNEIMAVDTSLMYQIPKEGDEVPAEEPLQEQPKASEGPRVILDVLEKEDNPGEAVLQAQAAEVSEAAVSDELMSEAMRKLADVIGEFRQQKRARISIKTATPAVSDPGGLKEINVSATAVAEEEPPSLVDFKPAQADAPAEEMTSQEPKSEEVQTPESPAVEETKPAEESTEQTPQKEMPAEYDPSVHAPESSPKEDVAPAGEPAAKPEDGTSPAEPASETPPDENKT